MEAMVTIAAAGDVHASEATRERLEQSFAALEARVDLVLLAGDLTTLGEPEQAEVLAEACSGLRVPVCAVLAFCSTHRPASLRKTHPPLIAAVPKARPDGKSASSIGSGSNHCAGSFTCDASICDWMTSTWSRMA